MADASGLFEPVPPGKPTFIDAPRLEDLASLDADIAITGMVGGVPYDMVGSTFPAGRATSTIREQSTRYVPLLSHYDFDLGGDVFAGRDVRIVDCGNILLTPGKYEQNVVQATTAIRALLDRGAVPFVFGGSHEVTIPVMRAYEELGSMFVVQIDAHFDWRDEINGVRDGLSSVMRRAAEMPWVSGMAQIGIRGVGSARRQEYDDAVAYGSSIIGAEEVHKIGAEEVVARIPDADRYYITLDADGLDPAIAPAVGMPSFGGLTYYEASNILRGVAAKGKIVGFDFPVIRPHFDVQNMTSLLAARLTLNMIGAMAHNGQIGSTPGGGGHG
jgi:agmatinase